MCRFFKYYTSANYFLSKKVYFTLFNRDVGNDFVVKLTYNKVIIEYDYNSYKIIIEFNNNTIIAIVNEF